MSVGALVRKMRETATQIERAAARWDVEHTPEAEQALLDLELELTLLQTEARVTLEERGALPCALVGNA